MTNTSVAGADEAKVEQASGSRVAWIDIVRGLSILGVLFFHFGPPGVEHRNYPNVDGVSAGLSRMWAASSAATNNLFDAVLLMSSGFGYHVQLFLVISGFVLAISDWRRAQPLSYGQFLKRRLARLLPPYYAFVIVLAVIGLASSRFGGVPGLIGSNRHDLLINLLLVRNFSEEWVWVFPGPLWFVPLILQLYLVYPLIARGMRARPLLTLGVCALITVVYNAWAVLAIGSVPQTNGASGPRTLLLFGASRLFEFAWGVFLAQLLLARGTQWGERMRTGRIPAAVVGAGLLVWLLGTALSFYRIGFIVSGTLIALGASSVFCWLAMQLQGWNWVRGSLGFLGRNSYPVFLVHGLLMPTSLIFAPGKNLLLGFAVFVAASLGAALLLNGLLRAASWLWSVLSAAFRPAPAPVLPQ